MNRQRELKINIAGMTVCLLFNQSSLAERLRAWYGQFSRAGGPPLVTVDVTVQADVQFLPVEPGPWLVRSSVRDGRLDFTSYFESGWVDLDRGRGALVMTPQTTVENFLRVLYAHLAIRRGALLLHAAGVIKDGRAYVFFGPSGSGKTTTARLSTDHTILSDDLVLLRNEANVVRAFGVPFRGELPETPRTNASAELARLFRLRQDDRHFVTPLNRSRALAQLVACAPFVMSTPAVSQQVMALAQELVTQVPVEDLHFRRDPGFWEIIEAGGP